MTTFAGVFGRPIFLYWPGEFSELFKTLVRGQCSENFLKTLFWNRLALPSRIIFHAVANFMTSCAECN